MARSSNRTLGIAALAFTLLLLVLGTITCIRNETRGLIDSDNYNDEIKVILENGGNWKGTHVIPYDVEKEQFVFDVEYDSYRLIPLKLVAEFPDEIGAILSYRFSESASNQRYRSENGNTVKAYQKYIYLALIDIETGETIDSMIWRAKMQDKASIPLGVATYYQHFSKEEIEKISDWIVDSMKEHIGYGKK